MNDLIDAGMRTFGNIADRWGLDPQQRLQVLGLAPGGIPTEGTLERMSHVFFIYRAIHTLLPIPERADGWMRATNSAAPFCGRAPIDLVIGGKIEAVRGYLGTALEPSFT
jgi:hypothetical protein